MTEEKCCTKCGKTKPITNFHRNGGRRRASCKECRSAETAAWRERHPDYMVEWTAANPEYMASYRAENPSASWRGLYRHRARGFGFEPVVEDFTKADVIELYGNQCWHCKDAPFEELDHHPVPVAAEGSHVLENVKPACVRCNANGSGPARAARKRLLKNA